VEFCAGLGAVKVQRDSAPTDTFCPAGLPGAGVTAVVIPRDRDEQDTGTDGDYRYGYPYRKHNTGLSGTTAGAGVTYWSRAKH